VGPLGDGIVVAHVEHIVMPASDSPVTSLHAFGTHVRRVVWAFGIVGGLGIGLAAQTAQPARSALPGAGFSDVAERQTAAVVSLTTRSGARASRAPEEGLFPIFGIDPPSAGSERTDASGLLLNASGDILTNYHVVADADSIEVRLLGDGRRRYRAVYVGGDPLTDTAIVRIDNPPPHLRTAVLGDSRTIKSGDWVMAIGNPFRLGHTVTAGVVSYERRLFEITDGFWEELIQTDVAINPGSSGGPLLNLQGQVIGINVAVLDAMDGSNIGIGFAIPINTVKEVLPRLRNGDIVRGRLGVKFHAGPILEDEARELGLPAAAGALVKSVEASSAAGHSGLRPGDVIVAIDGHPVGQTRDLVTRTSELRPGTCVTLDIVRNGQRFTRNVTVETWPSERMLPRNATASISPAGGLTLGTLTSAATLRAGLPSGLSGALVLSVRTGSPADEGGLRADDVVRRINGNPIYSVADALRELNRLEMTRPVFLLVWRDDTELLLMMRRQ
jgi:serine protease Do